MGELADRFRAYSSQGESVNYDAYKAIHDAIAELEGRVGDRWQALVEANTVLERRELQLGDRVFAYRRRLDVHKSALADAANHLESMWSSENNDPPPPSLASELARFRALATEDPPPPGSQNVVVVGDPYDTEVNPRRRQANAARVFRAATGNGEWRREYMGPYSESPPILPGDVEVTQLTEANLLEAADEIRESRVELKARAEAAERRADIAMAIATTIAQTADTVHAMCVVAPDSQVYSQIGDVSIQAYSRHREPVVIALLRPSQPPNPELLERAAMQLMEAYTKAKAEAEAAAVPE